MLSIAGKRTSACDGVSRRELMRVGALSLLPGVSLPRLLQAASSQKTPRQGRAKSVILINLFGGPSHLDMFDMKPTATANVRGEFKPISTSLPGTFICEYLPQTARWMHRSSLIRTVTHSLNSHHPYSVLTGYGKGPERNGVSPDDHPSMGSVCQYLGVCRDDVPGYVFMPAFPGHSQNPRPGAHAGFLGRRHDPLFTLCDPKFERTGSFYDPVMPIGPSLLPALDTIPDVSDQRLARRRSLLQAVDRSGAVAVSSKVIDSMTAFQRRAFSLLTTGKTRDAFNLSKEPQSVRLRYGDDLFGSSALIARRLVEAGTTFVAVHWECAVETHGCHWDMHQNIFGMLRFHLPLLDQVYSTLVQDLHDRGLLDSTLVIVTGEMGRTPRVNGKAGRDHWTQCGFCLMTGGGVRSGTVHGASDKGGAYPETHPVSPGDMVATIYQLLGIDPETTVLDMSGRPVHISNGGKPIWDVIA